MKVEHESKVAAFLDDAAPHIEDMSPGYTCECPRCFYPLRLPLIATPRDLATVKCLIESLEQIMGKYYTPEIAKQMYEEIGVVLREIIANKRKAKFRLVTDQTE